MTCTYKFVGADGKQRTITGQAAFKAFLADGGLEMLQDRLAFNAPEDRSGISQLAYQGYQIAETPRVQSSRKINNLIDKLDAGKITPQEFELQVRLLASRMAEVTSIKAANRILSERERGADIVREKLIAARRRNEIDPETTEFALWLLQQNPAIANGLGISVREQPANQRGAAGDYNAAAEIMRVFKGKANKGTAPHEILHHAERMMPADVQEGIRKEWAKAYTKALSKAEGKQRTALEQILPAMAGDMKAQKQVREAFGDGTLDADLHYQLVNPSEFWAVNATDILQRRYEAGSWIGKAKQWLREMMQKVKGLLGLRSDAPVLRGLQAVLDGTGERLSPKMLAAMAQLEDITAPSVQYQRRQRGRETEGWILSRDELGRFRFGAGAKAYRLVADVANNVLDKLGLKPVSEELGRAMRKMKAEIERAQRLTVDVAAKMKDLPEQERQMISDVIEGELKRGVKPPQHVLMLAASLQSIMSEQSAELVRLGMLSPEAAGRWDGKYLPRFYEQKLGDEVKSWAKAAKALLGRKKTMQGIGGSSLKSRGMFELINTEDLQDWLDEGWEVRDAEFDPATDETVMVWRDYTRKERDDMGEIRDAMFRFVMGYNKSQRDIALGRLYESLADNFASKKELPGYVRVPETKVEDTMARRYGKLAGKWVPAEVLDHLSAFDQSQQNELIKMYLKGLSMWKEGKTVLNPVSHANNVLSNVTMAHFAGVSYWDVHKYAGAMRDLLKNSPMVQEALDAGLFGGTFNRAELLDQMPPQLKALAGMSESRLKKGVDTIWNALSWFLRKPAATAYQAEDQFFRYLIYKDARDRGLDVEDSIDYSQRYIFTYDDLPKTARTLRDYALPFFAYTYKVVPPVVNTALEKPWRYAAPAAALYTVNALMYAMAASLGGGEDEDWWTVIQRYVTDPEFRDKARKMEEQERENLPPWMKGMSFTLGTPKAIRMGMDDVTNLPTFLDVSRIFPGGDLLDAHANAGGVPLLQPITPSNPVLNTVGAMIWNKDSFFGKEIVDKNDTAAEATEKRGKWIWQQFSPAVAVGNYHWDRAMNVIANQTGQPILGYTGVGKDGLPVQLPYAAAQTVGIKLRPIDLELSEQIAKSEREKMIRDLDAEIRQIKRLEKKGAITEDTADKQIERQKEKKQRLKEGLTVEGEKPK